MIPKRISYATHYLGAPKNWDAEKDGSCHGLVVRLVEGNVWQSAWEPTPAEIEALNDGALVILNIVGGQPPVSIDIEMPAALTAGTKGDGE